MPAHGTPSERPEEATTSPPQAPAPAQSGTGQDPSQLLRGPLPEPAARSAVAAPDGEIDAEFLARLESDQKNFARYSEACEIARGGMGSICKVWDRDLRRYIVMKVMLSAKDKEPHAASRPPDSRYKSRFLEEAQITGQLDHPAIVPIHDIGLDPEGRLFFTMPLIKGQELGKIIELARKKSEGWTQARLLTHIATAMEAVAFAHAHGVVHRDLKPDNIMIGQYGQTYVMDWGLARVLSALQSEEPPSEGVRHVSTSRSDDTSAEPHSPIATHYGDIIGTPGYMAPEQARGQSDRVGPHSDVYAFGAVLYQLLTGYRPFNDPLSQSSDRPLLTRILEDDPVPIRKLVQDVPDELVAIAEKAMRSNPDERYPSMIKMSADLRAYLEGRVVSAYETGVLAEVRKWIARNRVAATLGALVIFGAMASALFFLKQQGDNFERLQQEQQRTDDARRDAELLTLELTDSLAATDREKRAFENVNVELNEKMGLLARQTESLRVETDKARKAKALSDEKEAEALRSSYASNLLAAQLSLGTDDLAEAARRLRVCAEVWRGFEWQHLWQKVDMSRATVAGHTGAVTAVDGSAEGFVASIGADATLRLFDPLNFELREVVRSPRPGSLSPFTSLCVMGGGEWIALARADNQFFRYDCRSKTLTPLRLSSSASSGTTRRILASPDGSLLCVVGSIDGAGSLNVFAANALEAAPLFQLALDVEISSAAVDARGRLLALGTSVGRVHIVDLSAHSQRGEFLAHEGQAVSALAFAREADTLVSGSSEGSLRAWDIESQQEVVPFLDVAQNSYGHTAAVVGIVFCDHDERVATASKDGSIGIWNAASGLRLAHLRGHLAEATALCSHEQSGHLWSASLDATLRVWVPVSGEAVSRLQFTALDGEPCLSFSADGRSLYQWSGQRGVVWDSLRLEQQTRLTPRRELQSRPLALPDNAGFVAVVGNRPVLLSRNMEREIQPGPLIDGDILATALDLRAERFAIAYRAPREHDVAATFVRVFSVPRERQPAKEVALLELGRSTVVDLAFARFEDCLAIVDDHATVRLFGISDNALRAELLPPQMQMSRSVNCVRALMINVSFCHFAFGFSGTRCHFENLISGDVGRACLAFSPDDSYLAVGVGMHIYLWEVFRARDAEDTLPHLAHEFSGHEDEVTALAFSPTGDRLVSASRDHTLRIFEPNLAQGLVVLRGHNAPVRAVTFDGEGKRLASLDNEGRVRIHETSLLMLDLSARKRSADTSLSVIEPLLDEFGDFGPLAEVNKLLEGNSPLARSIGDYAQRLDRFLESPDRANNQSWRVVREHGRAPSEYAHALSLAHAACEKKPDKAPYLRTKAVAEYRVGEWNASWMTLEQLAQKKDREPGPEELATRAMVQQRLGRTTDAQQDLSKLSELMEDSFWSKDPTARAFYAEALELIPPSELDAR